MPKPKRHKSRRPPDRVDRLCAAVEELTVVAEALERNRVIGDGTDPPHSVALFRGLP